jgi:hypothetical protein
VETLLPSFETKIMLLYASIRFLLPHSTFLRNDQRTVVSPQFLKMYRPKTLAFVPLLVSSVLDQAGKIRYMPLGDSITEVVCLRGLLYTNSKLPDTRMSIF